MFASCAKLKVLDVSGFDTSDVVSMKAMFSGCKALTVLDVSGFDTSKVGDMNTMFQSCELLEALDVSGFKTANVTNMSYMFSGCRAVLELDVSGFDTSCVNNMSSMFSGNSALTELDLSSFQTINVTNMDYMFSSCTGLTSLDLTSFDTFDVTSMKRMFQKCGALETVRVSDAWTTENVTESENMFLGCTAVKGGNGTVYDAEHIGAEYARIDVNGTPGYFTQAAVMGDVNNDGAFNIADAVCLAKWLRSEPDSGLNQWTNGDFNRDNRLDARDLTQMKRALMRAMRTVNMVVTATYGNNGTGKVTATEFTVREGDVFFESNDGVWLLNANARTAVPNSKLVEIISITDTGVTYLNYTWGAEVLEWSNAYGEQSNAINSTDSFIVHDGYNYSYHITFSANT